MKRPTILDAMSSEDFGRKSDDLRQPYRTRKERVARLRERVKQAAAANRDDPIPGIIAGVLDLLEDEL